MSNPAETVWTTRVLGDTLDAIVTQAEEEIERFFGVRNIDWYDLNIRPVTNLRYEADVTVRLPA